MRVQTAFQKSIRPIDTTRTMAEILWRVVLNEEERRRRIEELRSRKRLSSEELFELIQLSPRGHFSLLPHVSKAGLHDLEVVLANLKVASRREITAYSDGYFVEVLALRSQAIELYLRMYLGEKLHPDGTYPIEDRRTLGALVGAAADAGLSQDVVAQIRAFNDRRRLGLHRLLLGAATYESLRLLCDETTGVVGALLNIINKELAKPIVVEGHWEDKAVE